jgi:ketosteroid isomerase-like protein
MVQAPAPAAERAAPTQMVTGFLRAFAAKDVDRVQSYLTDDAVLTMQVAPDAPTVLRGRAAVSAYLGAVFARYARIEIGDVVTTPGADGRTMVVEAKGTYHLADGAAHSVAYVWIVSVAGNRIVASRNYTLALPAAVTAP